MNMLRATVKQDARGWQLRLLDLAISADGQTEDAMLRDLEHALTAEYLLAKKFGQVPFAKLRSASESNKDQAWKRDGKSFRQLNLPAEVKEALALALGDPSPREFKVIAEAA